MAESVACGRERHVAHTGLGDASTAWTGDTSLEDLDDASLLANSDASPLQADDASITAATDASAEGQPEVAAAVRVVAARSPAGQPYFFGADAQADRAGSRE